MNQGAVIMAFNNERVDYVAMAAWSAPRIRRHLGIPVALITDHQTKHAGSFDHVVICDAPAEGGRRNLDGTGAVPWHNSNRMDVYEFTPWKRTVLLDADYVIASDSLRVLLDCDAEFIAHRWAYDVTDQDDFSTMNFFGRHRMPMWWATVLVFDKCQRSKVIFDVMRMVRDNWRHYRHLYGTGNSVYRNDHALSVALTVESGHSMETTDVPWSMATVLPRHHVRSLGPDSFEVSYHDRQNHLRRIAIRDQDLHVMAKDQMEAMIADQA